MLVIKQVIVILVVLTTVVIMKPFATAHAARGRDRISLRRSLAQHEIYHKVYLSWEHRLLTSGDKDSFFICLAIRSFRLLIYLVIILATGYK